MEIRLTRWGGSHEVSQSKRVQGPLSWVAIPVRQGRGYCRLVAAHGAIGLGVWIALVELSANQNYENRGVLRADSEDFAAMARIPIEEVEKVIPTLEAIGWVEVDGKRPESPIQGPAPSVLREDSDCARSVLGPKDREDRQNGEDKENIPCPKSGKNGSAFDQKQDRNGRLTIDEVFTVWNEIAERYGIPRILGGRKKLTPKVRGLLRDLGRFGTEPIIGDAMEAFAKQPMIQEKRYSLANFLPNAEKYTPEAIERAERRAHEGDPTD